MKAIKTLVIGMGALIVVGIGLLVWGLVRANSQMAQRGAPEPARASVTVPAPQVPDAPRAAPYLADIVLPAGAKVERMEAAGNLVVLQLSGGDGRIIVVDPRNGQVVGSIRPLAEGR